MQAPPTTGQHNLAISRPNNITCWGTVESLSMRHCGTCPPSSFGNSVHSATAASLTVNISKITKEKHVLHFRLSRQKHAKTHVNRLKIIVSELEIFRAEEEGRGKIHDVPPHLISWRRYCWGKNLLASLSCVSVDWPKVVRRFRHCLR